MPSKFVFSKNLLFLLNRHSRNLLVDFVLENRSEQKSLLGWRYIKTLNGPHIQPFNIVDGAEVVASKDLSRTRRQSKRLAPSDQTVLPSNIHPSSCDESALHLP